MWIPLVGLLLGASVSCKAQDLCGGFKINVVDIPKPSLPVRRNASESHWDLWDHAYTGTKEPEGFGRAARSAKDPSEGGTVQQGTIPGIAGLPCSSIKINHDGHHLCRYLQNLGMGNLDRSISGASVFDTWQFSLDWFVHRYIYNNCYEADPAKADLFFIPLPLTVLMYGVRYKEYGKEQAGSYVQSVKQHLQGLETWQRNGGKDHLIVVSRTVRDYHDDKWGAELTTFRNGDPFWSQTNIFSIEGPFRKHRLVNMPYPSFLHPRSDADVDQWLGIIGKARRHRHRKAFLLAGNRRCREKLIAMCLEDSVACDYFDAVPGVSQASVGMYSNMVELHTKYTFALQPAGDTPTRRGFFDSLLAGAIPIIFDCFADPRKSTELSGRERDRRYSLSYARFFGESPEENLCWVEKYALVAANEEDAFRIIHEIDDETIRQLQKNIAEVIPSLLYWDPREGIDAATTSQKYASQNPIARALRGIRNHTSFQGLHHPDPL